MVLFLDSAKLEQHEYADSVGDYCKAADIVEGLSGSAVDFANYMAPAVLSQGVWGRDDGYADNIPEWARDVVSKARRLAQSFGQLIDEDLVRVDIGGGNYVYISRKLDQPIYTVKTGYVPPVPGFGEINIRLDREHRIWRDHIELGEGASSEVFTSPDGAYIVWKYEPRHYFRDGERCSHPCTIAVKDSIGRSASEYLESLGWQVYCPPGSDFKATTAMPPDGWQCQSPEDLSCGWEYWSNPTGKTVFRTFWKAHFGQVLESFLVKL